MSQTYALGLSDACPCNTLSTTLKHLFKKQRIIALHLFDDKKEILYFRVPDAGLESFKKIQTEFEEQHNGFIFIPMPNRGTRLSTKIWHFVRGKTPTKVTVNFGDVSIIDLEAIFDTIAQYQG